MGGRFDGHSRWDVNLSLFLADKSQSRDQLMAKKTNGFWGVLRKRLLIIVGGIVVFFFALILLFRWMPVPFSAVMVERQASAFLAVTGITEPILTG